MRLSFVYGYSSGIEMQGGRYRLRMDYRAEILAFSGVDYALVVLKLTGPLIVAVILFYCGLVWALVYGTS